MSSVAAIQKLKGTENQQTLSWKTYKLKHCIFIGEAKHIDLVTRECYLPEENYWWNRMPQLRWREATDDEKKLAETLS